MKKLLYYSIIILFFNSCQVCGVTNDYDKLTDEQLTHLAPFTSFKEAVPGKVYEINAKVLKEEMKGQPKSLVYIFANGCTSSHCMQLSVFKDYADKNGYNLYLVMSGYWNLDKTLKQNIELPLYTISPAYYNTKYSLTYMRKFENELMDIPVETKRKDRKTDGTLFFYNYGILDTISFDLPISEKLPYDHNL